MPYPEQPFPISRESIFEIIKSSGAADNEFYVGNGVCYSTYSFETGSFLNIQKLNEPFNWGKNEKIFIEIDVGLNLGAKKARIKNEIVGDGAPESGWKNYPYFYKIEPQDDFDEKGKVTKIRDGKRQVKCYVLIGYLEDDNNKNGNANSDGDDDQDDTYVPVQILKENVLLVQSVVSGVPCLAPFPYFKGGLIHLNSILEDLQGQEDEPSEESSSSSSS
jgi:hypothetical protein